MPGLQLFLHVRQPFGIRDSAGDVDPGFGRQPEDTLLREVLRANPTIAGNHTSNGAGLGAFISSITGLSANQSYFVRAYATNANGTFYGNELQFSTLCGVFGLPLNEGFATATLPNCWTITDNNSSGQTWLIGAITGESPNPALTGNYAYLNSDDYGNGNSQNSDLVSPVFDLSAYTGVTLAFKHYFKQYSTSSGTVSYSINGGSTWTAIQSWTTTTANPATFSQTIAALAGQSQVRLKWNYTGTWAYYWGVDDIQLTGTGGTPTFAVTPSDQSVATAAGTTTFNVATTANWTAVSDQTWCSVTPLGSGNGTITATYTENTTTLPRVANITVSATSFTPIVVTVSQAGAVVTPTAQVLLRPQQIDLSGISAKSAVLMRLDNYSSDDVKYRLYNGSNQYNCWDGSQFVSSSTYSANPSVPGTPTTSTTWWIMFERGSNNSTNASYRDRFGPGYSSNNITLALPAADAVADPVSVSQNLPFSASYPLDQRYVVLGYDALAGGNLITATSSDLTSGAFSLVFSNGTILKRIEVRNYLNVLMEEVTGTWPTAGVPIIYDLSGGGSYCSGTNPTGVGVGLSGSEIGVNYQLQRNGIPSGSAILGTGTPLNWPDLLAGTYAVVATNGTNSSTMNGSVVITETLTLPASVTIQTENLNLCLGSQAQFTALATNGGSNPLYQWKVNGLNVGNNSPNFSFVPQNLDEVQVLLTSSLACVSGNPAESNTIIIQPTSVSNASVTITADQNNVCAGTPVQFTASAVNGGLSPSYQWFVNNLAVGTNSSIFSYNPNNNDIVRVEMVSSLGCVSPETAVSNFLTLTVTELYTVTLTITADANPVCEGNAVQFTSLATNAGSSPVYQWFVNGVNQQNNGTTFSYVPSDEDHVDAVLTSNVSCSANNPATSNMVVMQVDAAAPASVSITASQNPICTGSSVSFTAIPINGGNEPVYQWKRNNVNFGANSPSIAFLPENGDQIKVVMTSSLACVTASPASSNTVGLVVNPISFAVAASPQTAGTVSFTGTPIIGQQISIQAVANNGWQFVNWTDNLGNIVSTNATANFTVTACTTLLTAHFSSGNAITGKLLYFNPIESELPSSAESAFYVQLFDNDTPVGTPQMVQQGNSFIFNGLDAGKQYSLRLWEQTGNQLLGSSWTWNNWSGVTALDALIISYMSVENDNLTSFPWIVPAPGQGITAFALNAADVNASNSVTGLDALTILFRSVNYPGTSPFPGGKPNFVATAKKLATQTALTYPQAPDIPFTTHGSYIAGSASNSVYQQALLPATATGLNVINVFLTAAGDVNASLLPGAQMKSSTLLSYNNIRKVTAQNSFETALYLDGTSTFGALNLNLAYDPQIVEIVEVKDYEVVYNNTNEGLLSIAWMDTKGKTFSANEPLLNLVMRVKSTVYEGYQPFSLADGTSWADLNANELDNIRLVTESFSTADDLNLETKERFTFNNFPNPFKNSSLLQFKTEELSNIKLTVNNVLGVTVHQENHFDQPAGTVQLEVNKHMLRGKGMYNYVLRIEDQKGEHFIHGKLILTE